MYQYQLSGKYQTINPNETVELQGKFVVAPTPVLPEEEVTGDYNKEKIEKTVVSAQIVATIDNNQITRPALADIDPAFITSEPTRVIQVAKARTNSDVTSELIVPTPVVNTKSMFQTTSPVPPLELISPVGTDVIGELRDGGQTLDVKATLAPFPSTVFVSLVYGEIKDKEIVLISPLLAPNGREERAKDFPILLLLSDKNVSDINEMKSDDSQTIYRVQKLNHQ
ncbi:unnamed protein product [Pieris brassicae]|uniref:Uncharacterized protein n=1 Tax=Pieris brassicae TaxID=7116 RepID=A0A9P0TFJ6_PIEBR|nr:unnamed protein product [Pieris brassicae]